MIEFPRSPARLQSTAHYARSMGVYRTIQETARNIIWILLQKRFKGKNVQHIMPNECALHNQSTSYVQFSTKIAKLERSNKNPKHARMK